MNIQNKIKSKYITIKIFGHLNKNILLNIINYNKKYQKLMNKNLKSYKKKFYKYKLKLKLFLFIFILMIVKKK